MILARLIRRQFTSTASKATEITPIASKIDVPILPFQNFENLSERLTRQLTKNGVEGLFPIQAATFQAISRGSDVMARARTGTGKTLAFLLPMINAPKSTVSSPRFLVLCPTRELARQVLHEAQKNAPWVPMLCCHGGVSYQPQEKALKEGVDLVIGTPGRVLDLIGSGALPLTTIRTLCLDEADHMLDIGFAEDMEKILRLLRAQSTSSESTHQTLLFSATMPSWIQHVTKTYLKPGYENIDLVGNDSVQSGEGIEFIGIPSTEKTHISVLIDIIRLRNSPQSLKSDSFWAGKEGEKILIFTETKQMAAEIGTQLTQSFIRTGVLHGDLSQTLRDQTMKMFRSGEVRCVVATNVAARGIDVGGVELVIHSGLPSKLESFLHRSGRTGRAGKQGQCFVLFDMKEEGRNLASFSQRAKFPLTIVGAPQPEEVAKISLESTVAEKLPHVSSYAKDVAAPFVERVLSVMSPEEAVQRLLALTANVSGVNGSGGRSLLNARIGFSTLEFSLMNSSKTRYDSNDSILKWVRDLNATYCRDSNDKISGPVYLSQGKRIVDVPSGLKERILERPDAGWSVEEMKVLPALSSMKSVSKQHEYRSGRYEKRSGSSGRYENRSGSSGRYENRSGSSGRYENKASSPRRYENRSGSSGQYDRESHRFEKRSGGPDRQREFKSNKSQ